MTIMTCRAATAALLLAPLLASLLAACGGGGGHPGSANGTPGLGSSTANLDAYVGIWTSSCASSAIDTAVIARAASPANTLTIAVTTQYYANTQCTGDVIATQAWSDNATATYVGTVTSAIVPGPGMAPLTASVDKVTAQLPQRTVTVTGSFVSHRIIDGQANWCIDYAGSSVCVPDRVYAAGAAPFDGLALQGTDLYELKSNGVNYDAVERFTRK
jgi:hypothetical protein